MNCLIAGIGNPDRGDDGAGPHIVALLRNRVPACVSLSLHAGNLLELLEEWRDFEMVFCIDAAAAETPGGIHRITAGEELPPSAPASSHAFGLVETIALAAALQQLPPTLIIYAIDGVDFSAGAAMTREVGDACARVADMILGELKGCARSRPHAAAGG